MTKIIVETAAGGILCSVLAKALAKQDHKIAVLDLRKVAADKVADEINTAGGKALGYVANVLDKVSLESVKQEINAKLGSCDILINDAPGNFYEANHLKVMLPCLVFSKKL